MKSTSLRRLSSSASAALIFLLAVAPVVVAQTEPAGQAGGAKIDLNTASQAVLETLPGVDAATAEQIIAGRPYTSVAGLSTTGVSASTIEGITPLVEVVPAEPAGQAGGAKIDLNTASQAVLESLPGVDAATAEQIIAGRPYTSVAGLSTTGVSASTIEGITPLVKVGPLGRAAAATGKGADKAAAGVGAAADATAKGIEKGVSAATQGVQTAAGATASAAGTVNRTMTGSPRVPPQAGMVWANTDTKIYHNAGDPSYGTTKSGKWLTREEAVKQGYRAAAPPASRDR